MPSTTTEIAKYEVSVLSEGESHKAAAVIVLCGTSGKTIAFLAFYSTGSPLPPNEFLTHLGYPVVSYPFSELASVVDILRNEKPVYFTWYDYMPVRCYGAVGTAMEPVGELERI